MAAPLSGAGQQQQIPLTQALQPVNNDQSRITRQEDQQARDNQIQARGAQTAPSQESNRNETQQLQTENLNLANNQAEQSSPTQDRGSLIDITI